MEDIEMKRKKIKLLAGIMIIAMTLNKAVDIFYASTYK